MRGRKSRKSRRGVTLVEVMLAGALLALAVISLFDGIGVAARIARENAQVLQADAYAHDLAWKRFNESYSALNSLVLSRNGNPIAENVASNAAPALWNPDSPAVSYTRITRAKTASGADDTASVLVHVDVEWGPAARRLRLSDTGHAAAVARSAFGQEDR